MVMVTIGLSFFLALAAATSYRVGTDPRAVALVDVNDDGTRDIVTANAGSKDVTVLPGDGRGRFGPPLSSRSPIEPAWMAVADVNDDRYPDVAVAEHESYKVAVLLGDGKGHFQPARSSPFEVLRASPEHSHGLVFADFNADGRVDLVTANNASQSVSVLLGDGRGAFTPAEGSPVVIQRLTAGVAVGDLNGDRQPDVVAAGEGASDVTILLGNGKGGLRFERRAPVPSPANVIAIGDINGDGKSDVIVGHNEDPLVSILVGDGAGGFVHGESLKPGHLPRSPVLVDLNRDNATDLAVVDVQNGRVSCWMGDGRGRFRAARDSPLTVGQSPMGLAIGTLTDSAGMLIVTADSAGGTVTVIIREPSDAAR